MSFFDDIQAAKKEYRDKEQEELAAIKRKKEIAQKEHDELIDDYANHVVKAVKNVLIVMAKNTKPGKNFSYDGFAGISFPRHDEESYDKYYGKTYSDSVIFDIHYMSASITVGPSKYADEILDKAREIVSNDSIVLHNFCVLFNNNFFEIPCELKYNHKNYSYDNNGEYDIVMRSRRKRSKVKGTRTPPRYLLSYGIHCSYKEQR